MKRLLLLPICLLLMAADYQKVNDRVAAATVTFNVDVKNLLIQKARAQKTLDTINAQLDAISKAGIDVAALQTAIDAKVNP